MKVYLRDAFGLIFIYLNNLLFLFNMNITINIISLGVFLVCDIQSEKTQIQLDKYKENVLLYCEKFDDGPIPMIVL